MRGARDSSRRKWLAWMVTVIVIIARFFGLRRHSSYDLQWKAWKEYYLKEMSELSCQTKGQSKARRWILSTTPGIPLHLCNVIYCDPVSLIVYVFYDQSIQGNCWVSHEFNFNKFDTKQCWLNNEMMTRTHLLSLNLKRDMLSNTRMLCCLVHSGELNKPSFYSTWCNIVSPIHWPCWQYILTV